MRLTKLYKLEGNRLLRQTVISALAPEISVSCQILVLGSMPGAISQKEAEYYAHPRNLFWDCVETAFQIDRNAPYQARLAALNDAHIGLWDVLASCSRKASSDATIRDAKCNDFVKLLSAYPQINRICLNGRTAFDYWRRLVIPSLPMSWIRSCLLMLKSLACRQRRLLMPRYRLRLKLTHGAPH